MHTVYFAILVLCIRGSAAVYHRLPENWPRTKEEATMGAWLTGTGTLISIIGIVALWAFTYHLSHWFEIGKLWGPVVVFIIWVTVETVLRVRRRTHSQRAL